MLCGVLIVLLFSSSFICVNWGRVWWQQVMNMGMLWCVLVFRMCLYLLWFIVIGFLMQIGLFVVIVCNVYCMCVEGGVVMYIVFMFGLVISVLVFVYQCGIVWCCVQFLVNVVLWCMIVVICEFGVLVRVGLFFFLVMLLQLMKFYIMLFRIMGLFLYWGCGGGSDFVYVLGSGLGMVLGMNILFFMQVVRVMFSVSMLLCLRFIRFGLIIVLCSMFSMVVCSMCVVIFGFVFLCSWFRFFVWCRVCFIWFRLLWKLVCCSLVSILVLVDVLLCSMIFMVLCRCLFFDSLMNEWIIIVCRLCIGVLCWLVEVCFSFCMKGRCMCLMIVVSILFLFLKCQQIVSWVQLVWVLIIFSVVWVMLCLWKQVLVVLRMFFWVVWVFFLVLWVMDGYECG